MTGSNQVAKAMIAKDLPWLRGWLAGRYMVDVSEEWIATQLARKEAVEECKSDAYFIEHNNPGLTRLDSTCGMWWKNRIDGRYPVTDRPQEFGRLTTLMHIFFLHLEETEEMMARLREDKTPIKGGPSTPGIERTVEMPTPIDRTAAAVVIGSAG